MHRMKLFSDEVTTVNGIPVTTPERTWLDMAEMLSVDELVWPWATVVCGFRVRTWRTTTCHCAHWRTFSG